MNIAGRVASWSGFLTAKDYVQNGLIAMWDGIENAGWGYHDDNATTWKDLISGYDIQTKGSLFGADCLKVATGGARTPALPLKTLGNVFALQSVQRPTGSAVSFFSCDPWSSIFESWSTSEGILQRIGSTRINLGAQTLALGKKAMFDVLHSASGQHRSFMYLDGSNVEYKASGSSSYSPDNRNFTPLRDGYYQDLFCYRVYNRELSDEERLKNRLIDKLRFGIK